MRGFNPQNISNTLLSLNQMGLAWSSLSVGLQRGLLASVESNMKQFNPQDISNILLVLSRMVVLDERLELLLIRRAIELKQEIAHNEIHMCQICLALTWIQAYSDREYAELKEGLRPILSITESRLQEEVSHVLQSIFPNMISEHRLGVNGVISVDCFIPESNCIVEVHGPSHYNLDGSLNHKSIEQKQLLEQMGYSVKIVSYKDWGHFQSDEDKLRHIRSLVSGISVDIAIGNSPSNASVETVSANHDQLEQASESLYTFGFFASDDSANSADTVETAAMPSITSDVGSNPDGSAHPAYPGSSLFRWNPKAAIFVPSSKINQ